MNPNCLVKRFAAGHDRLFGFALAMALGMPSLVLSQTTAPAAPMAVQQVLARGPLGTVVGTDDVMSEVRRGTEQERLAFLRQPEAVQQMVQNLLVRRVLAAEAARDNLAKDPVLAASLKIAQDRVLSDARLARLDAQNEPSEAALDAQARQLYEVNQSKFMRPAQTRARHILLANTGPDSLQKAKDMVTKLRGGGSFEELAKANSIDKGSAAKGGDLGYFSAGQMVRPFDDAVSALAKPGDISEPVESQFGYHIIELEGRRAEGMQPYDEVRAQLLAQARTELLNQSRTQMAAAMQQGMSFDKAAIEAFSASKK